MGRPLASQYRVAFLGFSEFERSALSSYFRLAASRTPHYLQVHMLTDADFLVADADHAASVQLVAATERLADTVFIGSQVPAGCTVWMPRPIDALHVMRELDAMVALAHAAARVAAAPRARQSRQAGDEVTVALPKRTPAGAAAGPDVTLALPLDFSTPVEQPGGAAAALPEEPPAPDIFVPDPSAILLEPAYARFTPAKPVPRSANGATPPPAAVSAAARADAPASASASASADAAAGADAPAPAFAHTSAMAPTAVPAADAVPAPAPMQAPAVHVPQTPTRESTPDATSSGIAAPTAASAPTPAPTFLQGNAAPGPLEPPPPAPSAPLPRALLVDDSEIALRYLETRLQPWGLQIDLAGSSSQAIDLLAEHSYDLVFLDVELGSGSELGGLELCRHIKQSAAAVNASVVMVSAHHSELDRVRGALAGCDAYIAKPLQAPDLERLLLRHGLKADLAAR